MPRIQNAIMRKKKTVLVNKTKVVGELLNILKREDFIVKYGENEDMYEVELLYSDGECAMTKLSRVSKPGQRVYVKSEEIRPVMNGRGICIISTSSGMMSGALAKSKSLGGEYICNIW